MADCLRWIGYGCVLVCVALIGVGVLVYYIIRELIRHDEDDDG